MKKSVILVACSLLLLVGVVVSYAVDNVSRYRGQTLSQGGTTSLNGSTVVESESPTNAFKIVVITATVSGAQTASTNTFTTAFVATPTIVHGSKSGTTDTTAGYGVVTPTATTSTLIVSGMNSAGSTNNLPYILYGYTRTGKFE